MLETIKNTLIDIGNFITTIFDFVISLFEDLVYIVQVTGKCIASIPQVLGFLPSTVLTIFVAVFGIVVIYKIAGRE